MSSHYDVTLQKWIRAIAGTDRILLKEHRGIFCSLFY